MPSIQSIEENLAFRRFCRVSLWEDFDSCHTKNTRFESDKCQKYTDGGIKYN